MSVGVISSLIHSLLERERERQGGRPSPRADSLLISLIDEFSLHRF